MTIADHLLWLDLETTGSNPDKDEIIEVGAILTDTELNTLDAFQRVVKPGPLALGRMMQNSVVREMHEKNGLLQDVLNGEGDSVQLVATNLLRFFERNNVEQGKLVLAGSGVGHFDRKFVDKYMPHVSRWLRYWCIDVGVLRRSFEMWTGRHPTIAIEAGKTHRALDDAGVHLEEARLWRGLFKSAYEDEDAALAYFASNKYDPEADPLRQRMEAVRLSVSKGFKGEAKPFA